MCISSVDSGDLRLLVQREIFRGGESDLGHVSYVTYRINRILSQNVSKISWGKDSQLVRLSEKNTSHISSLCWKALGPGAVTHLRLQFCDLQVQFIQMLVHERDEGLKEKCKGTKVEISTCESALGSQGEARALG